MFVVCLGIIREEDLDRIDKIRNEDWVRGEEIDYNQKLVFSDDETDAKENYTHTKVVNNKRKEQEGYELRQSEERSGKLKILLHSLKLAQLNIDCILNMYFRFVIST